MSDNPFASPEANSKLEPAPRRWGPLLFKLFLVSSALLALAALLLPTTRRARPAALRVQCMSHIKNISVALHNYHHEHGSFPPAYTVDAKGKPLHSWRTLLLPYLEQQELYRQIDLAKAWNDPVNAKVLETSINIFQCPSASIPKNHTIYLGVSGADCCFQGDRPTTISDVSDGPSNTLIFVEVPPDRSVPWMCPQDADEALITGISKYTEFAHTGGFQAAMADGSVRFISVNLDRSTLKAVLTIAGGEVVGEL